VHDVNDKQAEVAVNDQFTPAVELLSSPETRFPFHMAVTAFINILIETRKLERLQKRRLVFEIRHLKYLLTNLPLQRLPRPGLTPLQEEFPIHLDKQPLLSLVRRNVARKQASSGRHFLPDPLHSPHPLLPLDRAHVQPHSRVELNPAAFWARPQDSRKAFVAFYSVPGHKLIAGAKATLTCTVPELFCEEDWVAFYFCDWLRTKFTGYLEKNSFIKGMLILSLAFLCALCAEPLNVE
jgi:hypothetical protein